MYVLFEIGITSGTYMFMVGGIASPEYVYTAQGDVAAEIPTAENPADETPLVVSEKTSVIVTYNGEIIDFTQLPAERNGYVFYPLEDVFAAFSGGHLWDGENYVVYGELNGNKVEIPLQALNYWVNGLKLDVPPELMPFVENERTYVYLDYIVEGLGLNVVWDATTSTIAISNPVALQEETATEPIAQQEKIAAEPVAQQEEIAAEPVAQQEETAAEDEPQTESEETDFVFPETEPDTLAPVELAVIPINDTNVLGLLDVGNWTFLLESYGLGVPVVDLELFFYEDGGFMFSEDVLLRYMASGFEETLPAQTIKSVSNSEGKEEYIGVFDMDGNALIMLGYYTAEQYDTALASYQSTSYGVGLDSEAMVKHVKTADLSMK